ncbi:Uncharacterised protein [Vibrio cholerae]|nr:Uncharacterised protein [Vibrio cholerae]
MDLADRRSRQRQLDCCTWPITGDWLAWLNLFLASALAAMANPRWKNRGGSTVRS